MAYNSYFTSILVRLALLLLTLTGLSYLMVAGERFFTLLFLALAAILQVVLLFEYLNRTNRNLARFLLLLTKEDTSVVAWKDRVERTFKGLHHSFKKVNDEISRIRIEKEKGIFLLRGIIQHMDTGVMVFDGNGTVELVNDTALQMMGLDGLEHISDLDTGHPGVSQKLSTLKYDSGNVLRIMQHGRELPLLVKAAPLTLEERHLRICSLQDIGTELEANEIESWQKMTRVLSHEISNSVTPISTLGAGIHRKLTGAETGGDGSLVIKPGPGADLLKSAELIRQRCNGLVDFMEHYKSYSRIPDPVPDKVEVNSFFENLGLLFREELKNTGIRLETGATDSQLFMWVDRKLLEQAFINLLRNSTEALKEQDNGKIQLKAEREGNRILLQVEDNGPGIPGEIRSQVFIPFFTTKEGGSGIGLGIVRKVILMSGGTIHFQSTGEGTVFYVQIPEYH